MAVFYTVIFIAIRYYDGTYFKGGALYAAIDASLRPKPANFPLWKTSAGTAILFSMFSTSYMAHTNEVKFYNELQVCVYVCMMMMNMNRWLTD